MKEKVILGFFSYEDDTTDTLEDLHKAGYDDMITYSPVPSHEIEHVLEHIRPKFKWNMRSLIDRAKKRDFHLARFSLLGGLIGFSVAVLLLVGTAVLWPVMQGGLPLVPSPIFGMIAYELTTITAILVTVAGFFILSKLPSFTFEKNDIHDPAFNSDKFGIALRATTPQQIKTVEDIMKKNMADKVEMREGRLS